LYAARADGKFKPLPRKVFTLGLHWLLTKSFGNDYRQEPWMIHTNDDLMVQLTVMAMAMMCSTMEPTRHDLMAKEHDSG
jgi:hypothetical protein